MEKEKKQIELRSEKVRNIIGQVPPVLLRYGISIIGLSLLVLVSISAFIPYQPSIETEITITQDEKGVLNFTAKIPQKAIKNRADFSEIILETADEMPLPAHFQIKSISDAVELGANNLWQTATLYATENVSDKILLDNPIELKGKILLEKRSVMRWIMGKAGM